MLASAGDGCTWVNVHQQDFKTLCHACVFIATHTLDVNLLQHSSHLEAVIVRSLLRISEQRIWKASPRVTWRPLSRVITCIQNDFNVGHSGSALLAFDWNMAKHKKQPHKRTWTHAPLHLSGQLVACLELNQSSIWLCNFGRKHVACMLDIIKNRPSTPGMMSQKHRRT